MMETVVAKVGGLVLKYNVHSPLTLGDEGRGFRGFAVDESERVDLAIDVVDAEGESHEEVDVCESFEGDCRGTEMPDHRWECGKTAEGREYIVVDFFTDIMPYNWIKLEMDESKGVLRLNRKESERLEICPYIYPLFNIMVSRLLRSHDGFLVHSSVVDDGGKGYLFTAVSGTGKSTMARIWQSEGAVIVNDDMNILKLDGDRVEASNMPMMYYNDKPKRVMLSGIFLISQSKTNFVRQIHGALAVLKFAGNTINQPSTKASASEHLHRVESVVKRVPVFELGFKPDADIVEVVRALGL